MTLVTLKGRFSIILYIKMLTGKNRKQGLMRHLLALSVTLLALSVTRDGKT